MGRSIGIGRLIAAMLVSTAASASFVSLGRREEPQAHDRLYPHQRAAIKRLEEQQASELLARDGHHKRHQPKKRKQRPNRAQRRSS